MLGVAQAIWCRDNFVRIRLDEVLHILLRYSRWSVYYIRSNGIARIGRLLLAMYIGCETEICNGAV